MLGDHSYSLFQMEGEQTIQLPATISDFKNFSERLQ
jgi:hypothetical protein